MMHIMDKAASRIDTCTGNGHEESAGKNTVQEKIIRENPAGENKCMEDFRRVLRKEAEEIRLLADHMEEDAVKKTVSLLQGCRGKIITSGCGTSGAAAQKTAHTLCCIEMPAFYLSPAQALHGGMGAVQKEDVVILFSKGGSTAELEAMGKACVQKGAAVLTVTENPDSTLAKMSTLVLPVKITREPDAFNMLATASTLGVIAVFDALSIAMANDKGYTKEEFLVIHPGGEVGQRLMEDTGQNDQ